MANEEPDYIVLKKESEIEIRQYKNFLTASIEMEGDKKKLLAKDLDLYLNTSVVKIKIKKIFP